MPKCLVLIILSVSWLDFAVAREVVESSSYSKKYHSRLGKGERVQTGVQQKGISACHNSLFKSFHELHRDKRICSIAGRRFVLDYKEQKVYVIERESHTLADLSKTQVSAYNINELSSKKRKEFELYAEERGYSFRPGSSGTCGHIIERLPFTLVDEKLEISNSKATKTVEKIMKNILYKMSASTLRQLKFNMKNADGAKRLRKDIYNHLRSVACHCGEVKTLKAAADQMLQKVVKSVKDEGVVAVTRELKENNFISKAGTAVKVSPSLCSSSDNLKYASK